MTGRTNQRQCGGHAEAPVSSSAQTGPQDGSSCGRASADGTAGRRVYAVGDLHGRLDLLVAMEALIEADRREHARYQDA